MTWWNNANNRFEPDNIGDSYDIRVDLKVRPTLADQNVTLSLDIGGTEGVIWNNTTRLGIGAGEEIKLTQTLDVYTLDTFVANGGAFYLESDSELDVYDIAFKIERKFRNN